MTSLVTYYGQSTTSLGGKPKELQSEKFPFKWSQLLNSFPLNALSGMNRESAILKLMFLGAL